MPFFHGNKQIHLDVRMTPDDFIAAIFTVASTIYIAVVRRRIGWKYIDHFHALNPKHKVDKSDRLNDALRDGRIKEYIFMMLSAFVNKAQRKLQIIWCFF